MLGFITRDYHRTAQVHFEAGYVPRHHSVESFAQAIRAASDELSSCAKLVIEGTAEELSPRRKWAYACASVLSSAPFLTY